MSVPLFDTSTPLAPLRDRLHAKALEVLDGGRYILGPEVAAFEREFADYLGARHAIGVANGTDALTIALRALGVGPGDEVVVPSFTFYASAEAIPPTGARPVFCDVDPETFCVTPETVRAALTPRTKAVIAVHLFGNLAPVEEIEALGVPVLEDAAQAAGSVAADGRRAGALGHDRDVLVLPLQEPRRVRGRRRRRHERRRRSPSACGCCASTARGTRRRSSWSATTRGSTSCRPRCCGSRCRTSTRWCDGRRAAAAAYEAAGLGELVALPRRAPARRPRGTSTSSATRSADELAAALKDGGDRPQGLLPRAGPPAARDARVRRRRRPPGHRGGRAHASRDPHEPGAQPRAGCARSWRPRAPWPRIECA